METLLVLEFFLVISFYLWHTGLRTHGMVEGRGGGGGGGGGGKAFIYKFRSRMDF